MRCCATAWQPQIPRRVLFCDLMWRPVYAPSLRNAAKNSLIEIVLSLWRPSQKFKRPFGIEFSLHAWKRMHWSNNDIFVLLVAEWNASRWGYGGSEVKVNFVSGSCFRSQLPIILSKLLRGLGKVLCGTSKVLCKVNCGGYRSAEKSLASRAEFHPHTKKTDCRTLEALSRRQIQLRSRWYIQVDYKLAVPVHSARHQCCVSWSSYQVKDKLYSLIVIILQELKNK